MSDTLFWIYASVAIVGAVIAPFAVTYLIERDPAREYMENWGGWAAIMTVRVWCALLLWPLMLAIFAACAALYFAFRFLYVRFRSLMDHVLGEPQ